MSKVAVVYWSGTGNTKAMAEYVAEGAKAAGADVSILTSAEFTADMMSDYDAIAFGCPSMLVCDSVICNGAPSDPEPCRDLGRALS